MKIFFCTLLFLLFQTSFAVQAPESRGSDFYVAFAYNYEAGLGQTQTLYISSSITTSVVVSTKTTTVATVNVVANSTVSVDVSSIYCSAENTVQNNGIRVHSPTNVSFTLVGLNSYPATTDAFLAFPVNILGTNYIAAGYTGCCGVPGYAFVVATQDGTSVTFSTTGTHLDGSGSTATYSLSSYQTVLVGISGGDITGMSVISNKPIALFGGAACSDVPSNVQACNVLVDQIPPMNTWDQDFVTVPIPTRTAGDIIRVVSGTASTVVTINGATVTTLASGAFYEFSSSIPNVIHTSQPALLMQYDKGSSADGASSDPFQLWIPPVNQYASNYFIVCPTTNSFTNWISIIIQSGQQSGLSFDGNAFTSTFSTIAGSNLVYTRLAVTSGSHHIFHSSPIVTFEVVVYGFGSYDGYGYVGGSRLAPLQDPCTQTATVPGDGIDNDCDGKIDEEIRNGIDDDGDGLIDEDLTVDTCCYTSTHNPTLTVTSGSVANVQINCGDSLPAVATVTATMDCSNSTVVSPTVTTASGTCPQGLSVTRTFSFVDSCGKSAASITQVISITQSVCGDGVVSGSEQCDGSACCTSQCTFASSSNVCRASAGTCDVAETCSGSSGACPADSFQSSSVTCRASADVCDVAEQCTGSSAACPADSFQSSSTTCRASAGVCDVSEQCTGSGASCPADSFQSSTTTCRASAGVCDVAEQCTGSGASCPANSFAPSSQVCRASAGICDVVESCPGTGVNCPSDSFEPSSYTCRPSVGPCDPAENCPGTGVTCPADANGSFETACAGLALQNTLFTYYDVISFHNFNGSTGDVEQRLAVGGNFNVGAGWSVGYQTQGTDGSETYAMIVNGNANFPSGAVYPDGSNNPRTSTKENVFVGGSFSGANYLSSRVTGNCTTSGCLSSQFSAAQQCYGGYQTAMSSNADNVAHVVQWSGLYITCNNPHSLQYYLTLTPTEMAAYTWISLTSCNSNAAWVVNIGGTGDITFSGGSFPVNANQIIYNVLGSGRTIHVAGTQVVGSILAPYNNLSQPSGVVIGKVIANSIISLQINRATCFTPSSS